MTYDRLTAADAAFLRIETPHEPQHVGSLSVLRGELVRADDGRIEIDALRAHVERRIGRVPRLRQRIMEVPYQQGRPIWVDDPDFDLAYHVRLTSLPRPGDEQQLMDLHSRLQSLHLDRGRPLWEMWFVDGLEGDRVGLIIKTHHALGDGIANVDLALALVDLDPDAHLTDQPADEWRPQPAPSSRQLLADSVWDQWTRPVRLTQRTLAALSDPRPAIDAAAGVAKTAVRFLDRREPAPWNRPVSPHRRWVHADVPLDVVSRVRAHHDVSINDVVLAACADALRKFLADHEHPEPAALKAMVPVSLRTEDEHGDTLGNLISMLLVELPTDVDDPLRRLALVNERTSELKGSNMVGGARKIVELADGVTPIAGILTRAVSRRIPMNLVITNIPGPPVPLYLHGAHIERTYPYVEVVDNEGLTIAVVSYDGMLCFGLTSDRDAIPDLSDLAAGIEAGFERLAEAAERGADAST